MCLAKQAKRPHVPRLFLISAQPSATRGLSEALQRGCSLLQPIGSNNWLEIAIEDAIESPSRGYDLCAMAAVSGLGKAPLSLANPQSGAPTPPDGHPVGEADGAR